MHTYHITWSSLRAKFRQIHFCFLKKLRIFQFEFISHNNRELTDLSTMTIIHNMKFINSKTATTQHSKQNSQQIHLNWNLKELVATFSPDGNAKTSSFFKTKTCLSIESCKVSSPRKTVGSLNDIAKKNVLMNFTRKQLMTLPMFLQKELKVVQWNPNFSSSFSGAGLLLVLN